MLKERLLPSGSLAVGANAKYDSAVAVVEGAPEIVGGRFATLATAIEKVGSAAVPPFPSATLMVIPAKLPTLELDGRPLSLPDDGSKAAQAGLLATENVSVSPSKSLAVGVNAYATPGVAVDGGTPAIVGALLVTVPEGVPEVWGVELVVPVVLAGA